MKYGIHTNLVEEVVDFVKNGELLYVPVSYPKYVENLNDLDIAKQLAWNQEFRWVQIRELQMIPVTGYFYDNKELKELQKEMDNLLTEFYKHITTKLGATYTDLIDDIVGDLHNAALSRAAFGKTDSILERIFVCYQHGGWPCGLRGEYPGEGSIIVYFPE